MKQKRVVILGGGISGLTVAYRLRDHAAVTLLEQADRIGGKLLTEHVDGFTIDHGPDVFLSRKPWANELCRELGLELQPTNPDVAGSFIKWDGRLHPLPAGFGGVVPRRLMPVLRSSILSPAGRLRLLAEPLVARRKARGDESLGDFVRRRLGNQARERLVGPLLGGIFGGDIDTLSLEATFPQLLQLETLHGSLLRGIARARSTNCPAFHAPIKGMGALPEALAAELGALILTGQTIDRVERRGAGWVVSRAGGDLIDCDVLVVATPAFEAARMVRGQAPLLAQALDQIPYNSSMLVTLGWNRPFPLNGYGYLVPRQEGGHARACTWSSSKIKGRAPEDGTLIRVFFGRGPDDPALAESDQALVERARSEVRTTLDITDEPDLLRVTRWLKSQPAYTMGHPERLIRIDTLLAESPGLFLTGAAYRGVGIPDCVRQANETAKRILETT